MNRINRIIKHELCLGCGLCEALAPVKCKMKLANDGFYYPSFNHILSAKEKRNILESCPSINIVGKKSNSTVWGNIIDVADAWSNDPTVRYKASSGGVVSALSLYMLNEGKVDGILHVGQKHDSYLFNELKVSRTIDDVLSNSGSRYAPSLVFNRIREILDESSEIFAFIGKPCDIAGLHNFIKIFPQYKNRIYCTISIFCAGIPSYEGTKKLLSKNNCDEEPYKIKYRGNGWPGFFTASYKNSDEFKISYNDSWGGVLGKELGFRCKICPDGIGLLADISVGDSWTTKDGYPEFEEEDGRSFVMIRTCRGKELFTDADILKYIKSKTLNVDLLKDMQRYQYKRRLLAGYRFLPVQILSGFIFNFRRIGLFNMCFKVNPKSGIGNMLGAFLRFIKNDRNVNTKD